MAIAASARLEARVTPALQELIKRAAELQGRSLTDFMVTSLQAAAQRAIEESEVIRLSLADQQRFADALLDPPKPAPALKRAMARHGKLLRPE